MSNLLDSVREQAMGLHDGGTIRGKCPKCGSEGTSFCISREGSEIRFIDFSASCNFRGAIESTGGGLITTTTAPVKKLFEGELTPLEVDEVAWLSAKFLIPYYYFDDVRYCLDDSRVYYPQYDSLGKLRSYIARAYDELAYDRKFYGAKAKNVMVSHGEAGLCFPSIEALKAAHNIKTVALLEDWPSTMRMWSQLQLPSACLAGTNLLTSHVNTLIEMGIETVVIILDADAVVKAVKIEREISLCFSSTIVLPLTGKDPKDLSIEELADTFTGKLQEVCHAAP
jgi:hypothetical protein